MKYHQVVSEAGAIPVTTKNTNGLTFGFEFEFLADHRWCAASCQEGYVYTVDSLDLKDLGDFFEFDGTDLDEAYYAWQEIENQPDASVDDYLMAVGTEEVMNEIGGSLKSEYIIVDGDIYEAHTTQLECFDGVRMQLENILNGNINIFANQKQGTKNFEEWYIEPDCSLRPNDPFDIDVEITSPVYTSYNDFISDISTVCNWVQSDENGRKVGYTNNSCGFHVNIGIPAGKKPDFVKMAVFLGEKYLHNTFGAGRLDMIAGFGRIIRSEYAKQSQSSNEGWWSVLATDFERLVRRLNGAFKSTVTEKYYVFNPLPYFEGKGYVEFRAIGGANYEKNIQTLVKNINRFIFLIQLACDPEMYRKEYMQKMFTTVDNSPVADDQPITLRQFKKYIQAKAPAQMNYFFHKDGSLKKSPNWTLEVLLSGIVNGDKIPMSIFTDVLKRQGITQQEISGFARRYKGMGLDNEVKTALDMASNALSGSLATAA